MTIAYAVAGVTRWRDVSLRDGEGLPRFVEQEFRNFLRCGWLAGGFARFRCAACGLDRLVAFSCKGRGFCPSCGGRRMAERAAHRGARFLVWVTRLRSASPPRARACHARSNGFDLHAGLVVPAGQRERLERVCRYALRPPVAGDRVRVTGDGQVQTGTPISVDRRHDARGVRRR